MNRPTTSIVLMGLRAAGKTTIARALGARTGMPVIDLDDVTLALLDRPTVAEAWTALGEPAFRAAESRALAHALGEPPSVISLGGGTPTAPGAGDALRAARRARIVYLHAMPEALRARLREGDPMRPSLTGAGTLDEIEAVYRVRDPIFRSVAHAIVDATKPQAEQVGEIMRIWMDADQAASE